MRTICSSKHHKVFVLHTLLYYLKLSNDYLNKSSMDKFFFRQNKILMLLKSSRSSHKDYSIPVLLSSLSYYTLVFTTLLKVLGHCVVGLYYHWMFMSGSGESKEPTGLILFAHCILNLKSMYQAIRKFSWSYIPLMRWLPVIPLTFFLLMVNTSCILLSLLLKAGSWKDIQECINRWTLIIQKKKRSYVYFSSYEHKILYS